MTWQGGRSCAVTSAYCLQGDSLKRKGIMVTAQFMMPTINCLEFPGLELKQPSHDVSLWLCQNCISSSSQAPQGLAAALGRALLQTPLCRRVCDHGEPHTVVAECPEELSAQKERKTAPSVQPWAGTGFVLVPKEGEASGAHPCARDGAELPFPRQLPLPQSPPKIKDHGELPHPADPGTPSSSNSVSGAQHQ